MTKEIFNRIAVPCLIVSLLASFPFAASGADSAISSDRPEMAPCPHRTASCPAPAAASPEPSASRGGPAGLINGFFAFGCRVNYQILDWVLSDKCEPNPPPPCER